MNNPANLAHCFTAAGWRCLGERCDRDGTPLGFADWEREHGGSLWFCSVPTVVTERWEWDLATCERVLGETR